MTNSEIAKILYEMSALYEMEGVQFKPRAYEKAALGVEALNEEIKEIYNRGGVKALEETPGVGKGIAFHVEKLLKTGHFQEYERLKKKIPVRISELTAVEGVGPRMVKTLWEKLKIRNLADLEKAARGGKVRKLEHFGEKSEQKILKGIEFLRKSGGRQILGFVLPGIRNLEKMIRAFPEVGEAIVCGSVRRKKETIGDVDILATSSKPQKVMDRFLGLPFIAHVYGKGRTKTMVKLENGLDADIRVVPGESFGAAVNYFTGSKDHNIALREIAIKKGWKLNEYGLFASADLRGTDADRRGKLLRKSASSQRKSAEKMIAGRAEEEIYKALGLRYIEPEMRESLGEIEAARQNKLPELIGYGDLKGDLQVQTDWTDGEDSIETMIKAAMEVGLEYIAITDHTKSLAMTGGSDEKKLLKQIAYIDKLNSKFQVPSSKFRVLKGAEVNIDKDGKLDIKDDVLAKLDVVGAAVHSHFTLPRAEQTTRIIRAMENPNVDIIFHLTGRIINRREPIDVDMDEIIKAAKRTGTILEIDAYPDRLDIKDEYIRKCVEQGVKMSIDSDAHSVQHFKFLEIGIAQARRGWAERKDIINAWPRERMLKMLK